MFSRAEDKGGWAIQSQHRGRCARAPARQRRAGFLLDVINGILMGRRFCLPGICEGGYGLYWMEKWQSQAATLTRPASQPAKRESGPLAAAFVDTAY